MLCFCASCSSDSDDDSGSTSSDTNTGDPIPTEATGEYTATDYLATQINTALAQMFSQSTTSAMTLEETEGDNNSEQDSGFTGLSGEDISLTINSGNTIEVSVDLSSMEMQKQTFSGTCTYTESTSSFAFELEFDTSIATIGNAILEPFKTATYKDGALYDTNGTTDDYKIFTKNVEE